MMLNGVCYQRPKWERHIKEIGSGLLPTPRASIGMAFPMNQQWKCRDRAFGASNLEDWLAKDCHLQGMNLKELYMNPQWVEWMMLWPLGWTALRPLGMRKFRQWQRQHGGF